MKDNNEARGEVLIRINAQTGRCTACYNVKGNAHVHISVLAALMSALSAIMKEPVESIAHGINRPVEAVYMDILRVSEAMKQADDGAVDAEDFLASLLREANGGKQ